MTKNNDVIDTVKDVIETTVKAFVDYPEDVRVNCVNMEKTVFVELMVNSYDKGKVIGKNGTTATALKNIVSRIGAKNNVMFRFEICK